jgi:hypothetical protein
MPLNAKIVESSEHEMIDVNDFMTDMSQNQRHRFILKVNEGLSVPIFSYYWSRGGSMAGINPHVIWRIPLQLNKNERDEGMTRSQNNVDYLNNNTSLYHSRAERTSYMAIVINTNFVNGTGAAQAIYGYITGG